MIPEQVAERLADAIASWDATDVVHEPEEDLRTDGGFYIDATIDGVEFTISVARSRS